MGRRWLQLLDSASTSAARSMRRSNRTSVNSVRDTNSLIETSPSLPSMRASASPRTAVVVEGGGDDSAPLSGEAVFSSAALVLLLGTRTILIATCCVCNPQFGIPSSSPSPTPTAARPRNREPRLCP